MKTPWNSDNNMQDSGYGAVSNAKTALRRVQDAVKWRQDAKYDEVWARLIKLYGNRYSYPELGGYEDVVAPNMLFSTVNVIVPSVSVNYPKITVNARVPQNDSRAATVEAMANYTWQYQNVHDEFRLAVKDFVVMGHGWCKTTWSFVEADVEWDDQSWQDEAQARLMKLEQSMATAQSSGMNLAEFPTADDVIDGIPSMRTVVREDCPVVERVSPFDMFIDPDATRLKNARWIAQRMYIPLEVAKERADWSPKARKQLAGKAMSEAKKDIDIMFDGEERGTETGFAVVWEYYDLIGNKVCTFAEGCDDYLSKPEPVPFAFDHPFVPIMNYQIPDKLYPLGDVEAVAPLQMELALTRTQLVNDRKRMRRMYMYRPDEIGVDGVTALQSGDDNALISVEGDRPFGDILAPVNTTPLMADAYNQTAMILDDINLVSGVSEYARGATTEIRRTATEANMIQDGANARSADKLAIIERAIGEVAERIVSLAQQFLTTEQVARVVGPDGASMWVPYTREELSGEWDFQIEAGSTQPQNESSRRQSAMQLMDAMAPFIGTVIDPGKMAEHLMRNGFGIKNPQDFMMAPPMVDPMTGEPLPPGMPPGAPPGAPPGGGMPQGGLPVQ